MHNKLTYINTTKIKLFYPTNLHKFFLFLLHNIIPPFHIYDLNVQSHSFFFIQIIPCLGMQMEIFLISFFFLIHWNISGHPIWDCDRYRILVEDGDIFLVPMLSRRKKILNMFLSSCENAVAVMNCTEFNMLYFLGQGDLVIHQYSNIIFLSFLSICRIATWFKYLLNSDDLWLTNVS